MTAAEARDLALSSPNDELSATLEEIKKAASKGYTEVSLWGLSRDVLKKLNEMGYSTPCQGRNGFGNIVYKISWILVALVCFPIGALIRQPSIINL